MPDLLTHLAAGYGIGKADRAARFSNAWLLFGAILPDLLTRPFSVIDADTFWVTMPLHTPLGLALVCLTISLFFHNQPKTFWSLLAGCGIHLFLDIFQKHIAGSYYLFFPFSWSSFELDLVWPETSLYLLPLWLLIGAIVLMRKLRLRVAQDRHQQSEQAG